MPSGVDIPKKKPQPAAEKKIRQSTKKRRTWTAAMLREKAQAQKVKKRRAKRGSTLVGQKNEAERRPRRKPGASALPSMIRYPDDN